MKSRIYNRNLLNIGENSELTPIAVVKKMNIYSALGNALTCDEDAFACGNGEKCIPKLWKCDSEHDCVDGSDEVHCGRKSLVFLTTANNKFGFSSQFENLSRQELYNELPYIQKL